MELFFHKGGRIMNYDSNFLHAPKMMDLCSFDSLNVPKFCCVCVHNLLGKFF